MRSNYRKQTIAYRATILWDNIPVQIRDFNTSTGLFKYLLSEQHFENLQFCYEAQYNFGS